jgi:hypothetical protein
LENQIHHYALESHLAEEIRLCFYQIDVLHRASRIDRYAPQALKIEAENSYLGVHLVQSQKKSIQADQT